MHRGLSILLFLLAVIPVCATTVTAAIESYESASLTYTPNTERIDGLAVRFNNTSHSAGRVGIGHEATLSIMGWPAGEIQSIVLYMRSNASSGAAHIALSLNDSTWLGADGEYYLWPGMTSYSSTELPLSCLAHPVKTAKKDTLTITITGQQNAVYLQKVEVAYTEAPKEPHQVVLHWVNEDMTEQTRVIREDSAGSGILLPSVAAMDSVIDVAGEMWHWIGWCQQTVETTSIEPIHWEAEDWYGPTDDDNLYALYSNKENYAIGQDSTFTSQEYALVHIAGNEAWMLAGEWSSRVPMKRVPMQREDDQLSLVLSELNDSCRYTLTFFDDSVTIKHVASDTWLGYSKTSYSKQQKRWPWLKASNGTLYVHGTWTETSAGQGNTYWKGKSLCLNWDPAASVYYMEYATVNYYASESYWYLFPTASVPSLGSGQYTTFALPTALEPPSEREQIRKVLRADGTIMIIHNNQIYEITGKTL